jgi:segregation and condensation protein A
MVRPRACPAGRPRSGSVAVVAVHVRTPVFEGPFDVLLRLVSEHELEVCDIPLAEVVDAFVAELAARPEGQALDLDGCSEFLVIAAILVELKSRALLPGPDEVDDDEELSGFDERDRLLARLYELQAYASAADAFAVLIEQAERVVPRRAGLEERFRDLAPELLAGVDAGQLAAAYRRAVAARVPPGLDLSHVTVEAVTVSEAVAELEQRLPSEGTISFRRLTRHCATRMEVIVRFLALLELCKRGWVTLEQGTTFGDVVVSWIKDASPAPPLGLGGGGVDEYDG